MSALDINNIENYALQDSYSLSTGLGSDWQSLESAFEKEFLVNARTNFTSSDLITHLLEYDITDDDLETPFMSLIHSEAAADFTNGDQNFDMNIGFSDGAVAANSSSWQINDIESRSEIVDIEHEDFLARGSHSFFSTENEKCLHHFDENSTPSDASPPAKSKSSRKKSKKSSVTRSVITETIFNGSIADIVKTRKRGAAKDNDAESQLGHETLNSSQVSSTNEVPCSSSATTERVTDQMMPKIKLCIKLKKCDAGKEGKSMYCADESTKSKSFNSSSKKSRKTDSEKKVNKKLKKQMKKQKKPNVKSNVPEPPEVCLSRGSESIESGLESNTSSPFNSLSSGGYDSMKESPVSLPLSPTSEENITVENTPVTTSICESKPEEDSKPEISESVAVHAPPKKKLRGIEEYKALRAKIKPAGKASPHINNLVLDDTVLTEPPKLNHDHVINQLQKHLVSEKSAKHVEYQLIKIDCPASGPKASHACRVQSNSSTDSKKPTACVAAKVSHVGSQIVEKKEQKAQSSVPPMMPIILPSSTKESEAVEICAKTFSPINHSISPNPLVSNSSHNIPTLVKSAKNTSVIKSPHHPPVCNKTKIENHKNPSVPFMNVPDTGLSNTASEISGTKKDAIQDTKKVAYSPVVPALPFQPSPSLDKPQKRQYRRRYDSWSSDSDSQSGSSHHSNSSPRRSSRDNSQRADKKGKRVWSQRKTKNVRHSNLNKSSTYRYKRRSSSRSRSLSSSSLSDSVYEAYGFSSRRSCHRSSISPAKPNKNRHYSKYHSTKTSQHRASKDRSRYSPSPPRRRYHRYDRHCSSSSYSTTRSYSKHRDSSSSSRSRSRERYPRQYQSSRSSCSSRQQPNRWDEPHRQNDERRVVYVGVIPDGYTQAELHDRFSCFGRIENVRIHMRGSRRNDNYGFVTFHDKQDAYRAVERGNDHPLEPKFGISFGGRRQFCSQRYSDLDKDKEEEMSDHGSVQRDLSFDNLLQKELKRIKVRGKKC